MGNGTKETKTKVQAGTSAKGSRIITDLTAGSVTGTLIRFALPLLLSGFLQMIYNMVDMVVVSRFVGTKGLSAVSIGGEILQLVTFIAMGFSNAGQILLSRYVGEKRHDRIGDMVGTLFTLLIGIAVALTALMMIGYQPILHWLNTPNDIYTYTQQYSRICVLGIIFIYGYNMVSAIMRGMGDSRHPFYLHRHRFDRQHYSGPAVRRPLADGSRRCGAGHGYRPGSQRCLRFTSIVQKP